MRKLLLVMVAILAVSLPGFAQSLQVRPQSASRDVVGFLRGAAGYLFQASKSVTFAWDAMPAGEVWTEVRLYETTSGIATLVGAATCTPGPPISCPTTLVITVSRGAHTWIARSWDGTWESADSNSVSLPGPPKTPTNLKRQ